MHMFDIVDVIFDFCGFILGYGISPDSRWDKDDLKGRLLLKSFHPEASSHADGDSETSNSVYN
jgi:hypothetical protein